MGDVQQSIGVLHAPVELKVSLSLFAAPNLVGTARNMIVVVVLMKEGANQGSVNNGKLLRADGFDQPMIEPKSSNGEVRNRGVHASRENEDVDAGMVFINSRGFCSKLERLLPTCVELKSFWNIQVDALANEKGFGKLPLDKGHSASEITEQNDIGVNVGQYRKARRGLGSVKEIIKERSAELVRGQVGDVADVQFAGDLRSSMVIAEEDHFGLGVEERPAPNSVALNDLNMSSERFRRREKGDHNL